jgi:hypothetical protein
MFVEFVQELKRAFNDRKERRVKTRELTRMRVGGHRNKVVALSIGEVDAFDEGLFLDDQNPLGFGIVTALRVSLEILLITFI